MKNWSPIFNIIAVIAFVVFCATLVNVSDIANRDFDQERYSYVVQKATEAMFEKTVFSGNTELDYSDLEYVEINCANALETFDRVVCYSYDMSPSKENFALINDSIAACVIAGFNGYYVLETSLNDKVSSTNPGYTQRFSVKIPYTFSNSSTTYIVDAKKASSASMKKNDHEDSPVVYTSGNSDIAGLSQEAQFTRLINKQITDAAITEMLSSNKVSQREIERFRIRFPDEQTVSGVNPISVPGIIMFCSNASFASKERLESMSVAGYKVVRRNRVLGFYDSITRQAYYCYEGQLQDSEKSTAGGRFVIEDFFKTKDEACRATSQAVGKKYTPYYDIIARKININENG
ncbi:MAG: hypothetical protein IJ593_00875 [Lachnospiraceae bacterium]|nr:hypothetical protein [Lachnospiraceae bacterium]